MKHFETWQTLALIVLGLFYWWAPKTPGGGGA
jgi:hypothetical protein